MSLPSHPRPRINLPPLNPRVPVPAASHPLLPTMQHTSHNYPPSSSPWPQSSRPVDRDRITMSQERIIPQVEYSLPLLARIGSAEEKVRYSSFLNHVVNEQRRIMPHAITRLDVDGRLHLPRRKRYEDLVVLFGFPERDDDVDYCLEDTPGLSKGNFGLLKMSLQEQLVRFRQAAIEACGEVEMFLAHQLTYRVVTLTEVEKRLRYVVGRILKGRKAVLHKYRGYVRNRRWIENVATRQRRGCLTHKQNNILRMWLFSNFGNPYPDTPNKRRLINQTGLTMTQINNWLINARSRVWKPTIELMAGEKIKKEFDSASDREVEPVQGVFGGTDDDWAGTGPSHQHWAPASIDFGDHVN